MNILSCETPQLGAPEKESTQTPYSDNDSQIQQFYSINVRFFPAIVVNEKFSPTHARIARRDAYRIYHLRHTFRPGRASGPLDRAEASLGVQ